MRLVILAIVAFVLYKIFSSGSTTLVASATSQAGGGGGVGPVSNTLPPTGSPTPIVSGSPIPIVGQAPLPGPARQGSPAIFRPVISAAPPTGTAIVAGRVSTSTGAAFFTSHPGFAALYRLAGGKVPV